MRNAISVQDGGSLLLKEKFQKNMNHGDQAGLICIEDPLEPGNDVGKSSYGAMIVKQAFEKAYFDLTGNLNCNADARTGIADRYYYFFK